MHYQEVLRIIIDRTEGLSCGNTEYERGQLELAADMFARPLMDTGDRVDEIRTDVRNLMWAQDQS